MPASDSESVSSCGSQPVHDTVYPLGVETEVPGTEGGLKKTVLVEGTGKLPAHGAKVTVHYVGTLESDGSQFDSSRDRGEYFEFTIGRGQVIKGWDKGVATMRVGEKAILRCTSDYAYGAAGSPPKIPANATLLFEVELFDWTKEEDISPEKDKTIMKNTATEGIDYEKPGYESTVTLDLRVYQGTQEDGKLLAERNGWTFVIGDESLPPSLETCLSTMRKKEAASFRVAASIVSAPFEPLSIAAGEALTYTVELHELKTVKTWEFTGQAKVDEGMRRKEEGNDALKRGDLERAERKYRRSLEFVDSDYGMDDEVKVNCHVVRVAVLGNLSQVLLQQQKYSEVMGNCKRILEIEPKNLKALFRRARAADGLQEWDAARTDLEKLLEIDPNNADANQLLHRVNEEQKVHLKKQQALYKKMFAA